MAWSEAIWRVQTVMRASKEIAVRAYDVAYGLCVRINPKTKVML